MREVQRSAVLRSFSEEGQFISNEAIEGQLKTFFFFSMKSLKKAILFGFFIWLIAFSVAFLLYPIHDSHCPLFESIMPVVISLTTVFFTMKYFRNITKNFQKEGFLLGVMIICVNWGIDLLLFLPKSPMQMSLSAYIQDIGITYFMILPITFGFGIFLEKK